jgi:hypothetical protein
MKFKVGDKIRPQDAFYIVIGVRDTKEFGEEIQIERLPSCPEDEDWCEPGAWQLVTDVPPKPKKKNP